jgi:hypothetical protein
MSKKIYKIRYNKPTTVSEPVTAYQQHQVSTGISSSDKWNPNVPFHVTEEEWMEHIRQIEAGPFTPLEEANKEFEKWKQEFLARRLI